MPSIAATCSALSSCRSPLRSLMSAVFGSAAYVSIRGLPCFVRIRRRRSALWFRRSGRVRTLAALLCRA